MEKQPKKFQIVLIGVFVVLLILGFLGFSGKLPLPSSGGGAVNYGNVTLWGTIPVATMQELIASNLMTIKNVTINYVAKSEETFNTDFIEALASGKGPDLILLPQDDILKKLDKLSIIPYQVFPERDFKNTFIEEGEMFLRPDGVLALPFTIDPIVMYWNRDIFTSAFLSAPPMLWSDFYDLVPKITTRDRSGNITRSLVSFGEYNNVSHAKEIVSTLMMQAGSPIVLNKDGALSSALIMTGGTDKENPVITAMRFFTEFSKVDKTSYSWNRSLPESRSMFEAGDLAIYFGYASEYQSIKKKNPHLNFDVGMIPQVSSTAKKLTFGRMHGVAVTSASLNQNGAYYAASLLTGKDVVSGLGTLMGLPPVRRDLIAIRQTDAISSVFYDSAIISRGWYDPSPNETNKLFMAMFDGVTSGRNSMTEALSVADSSLKVLLRARK